LACQQPVLAGAEIEVNATAAQLRTKADAVMRIAERLRADRPRGAEGLGVAIDVGTTTLAVYVFVRSTGVLAASAAGYNPQRDVGADIIARIGHVRRHGDDGLAGLQRKVLEGLNRLLNETYAEAESSPEQVSRVVVAGNPTMLHLLAGISPVGIDQSPFRAAFLEARTFSPDAIGLRVHPEAAIRLLPSALSYVGSDIVAGVLALALGSEGRTELLVDIGTNGEIVLAKEGDLVACSTAAGPAFEGAAIRQGMNAVAGAIEAVTLEGDRLICSTIEDAPARGLCGTGLISAVHALLERGLINLSGRLTPDTAWADRFCGEGKNLRFILSEGRQQVALYQEDIRAFQLGKAAIRAGIDTLLQAAGITPSDLDRVYVAGAFGTHLEAAWALGTGLLPDIPVERIHPAGNTAGQGAAMVLLDEGLQAVIDDLAKRIENVELAAMPEFTNRYLNRMAFPHP